jgi:Family of unknown function (DUF6178)
MPKRVSRRRRRNPTSRTSSPVRHVAAGRSSHPTRDEAASLGTSLARLLEAPHLARVVPHLAPETLHRLIQHAGLEACGEIVASATPAQLESVFDLDLWRHVRPGRGERFDADRFGEWLGLFAEAGGSAAARAIAAMDEKLLIAGLSLYVHVFDLATIAPPTSVDGEAFDVGVTTPGTECEVGGYLVRAIRTDAWDAVVSLLLALDADHPGCFHTVMQGCRRLSNSTPERDGLDDLLLEPEQLFYDMALERDRRRSRQGYTTTADARAFLQLARQPRRISKAEVNPVVAGYFRDADEAFTQAADRQEASASRPDRSDTNAGPESLDAVLLTLADAGIVPERPRALLEGTQPQSARLQSIRTLMDYVRHADDAVYVARNRELAFLANTLVAGCSIQSRSLTPREASDVAIGACNLGLEHWPAHWPEPLEGFLSGRGITLPDAFLMDQDLVAAFEVGWAVLHDDVCMFVAGRLIAALSDLRCGDPDTQGGLDALRIQLTKHRDAGTPWRARQTLEVIALLDMPAWNSLLGLIAECPVLPASLTATLEGRTRSVSATGFECISTRSQLVTIRAFMLRLPDILRG